MGVAAYADELVLVAPTRHAMQQMLAVCEDYADQYNICFSTDENPRKSKTKCIHMVGKELKLTKPVPLRLCGRDLPWVESATHLGHEVHQSGTMEHDAKIARARFIDQSVEVRQAFSFASPAEIIRALQVYCSSHYGSMLWDLQGVGATQYFNSWTTAIKLAWDCPLATRSYLVQEVLACGSTSARTDIMARFCKFFQSLRRSPCREVAVLANLMARDVRSTVGKNIRLITEFSGRDPWTDSPVSLKAGLVAAETVDIPDADKWRVSYLGVLLEQRQEWHYLGAEEEEANLQKLVASLCIN